MHVSHRTAWVVAAALTAVLAGAGCHGASKRPMSRGAEPALVVPAEPTLGAPIEPGAEAAGAAKAGSTSVTWVDRHPLFTKPKEWYETTASDNRVVKGVAATVIGVPAGVLGELKQIVTGSPSNPRY